VATEGGLSEFRGRSFTPVALGISGGAVFDLEIASDSSIWVLHEEGIFHLSQPNLHQPPVTNQLVSARFHPKDQLFQDQHHRLWVTAARETLILTTGGSNRLEEVHPKALTILDGPSGSTWGISRSGTIYSTKDGQPLFTEITQIDQSVKPNQIAALSRDHILFGGTVLLEFTWNTGQDKG
jgi:hypothetical protein